MKKFMLGMTFYPFPVIVPGGAFYGWAERDLKYWFYGVLTSLLTVFAAPIMFVFLMGI